MNRQQPHHTLLGAILVSGMLTMAAPVHALDLTPADADWTSASLAELQASDVEAIVGTSPLALAYKTDFGGSESGSAAAYYDTSFILEGPDDASGATITQTGTMKIACPDCYLVVKDGNHPNPQYIFDLGSWNGTDTINLSGFWEDPVQGAISNIAIWNNLDGGGGGGGTITPIPEAETYAMMLAGLGLVGFAVKRRRA